MRLTLANLIKDYKISTEDDSSGKASTEKEYVFYAKLLDPSILENATKEEHHEQWGIKVEKNDKNMAAGRLRVRKIITGGSTEHVMTIKVEQKIEQVQGGNAPAQNMKEAGISVSEDIFIMFRQMSDSGMIKTRYTIPFSGMNLEVDRFYLPNNEFSDWVKIDLEVSKPLEQMIELPEAFGEVVYNQADQQTPEEKELVTRLYENVFLSKHTGVLE